jgi:hypothetical protein
MQLAVYCSWVNPNNYRSYLYSATVQYIKHYHGILNITNRTIFFCSSSCCRQFAKLDCRRSKCNLVVTVSA